MAPRKTTSAENLTKGIGKVSLGGGISMAKSSSIVGLSSLSKSNPTPTESSGLSMKKSTSLHVFKNVAAPKLSILESPEGMRDFLSKDETSRRLAVEKIINSAIDSKCIFPASDLTAVLKECGLLSPEGILIINSITSSINKKSTNLEGLLFTLDLLLKNVGRVIEPYVFPLIPHLFNLASHKTQGIRDFVNSIFVTLADIICPFSFRSIYPMLVTALEDSDWKIKIVGLEFLKNFAPRVSTQITPLLVEIIPLVSECIGSPKRPVQLLGMEALTMACKSITNEDILGLVPQLVSVIGNPDEANDTLDALLETTFVSNVDAATLALIAPLLGKALKGRSSPLKRKAARVIDNMCRLVQEPSQVAPFMPLLLPSLKKVIDEIADEEVCDVAKAARITLINASDEGKTKTAIVEKSKSTLVYSSVKFNLSDVLVETLEGYDNDRIASAPVISYIANSCAQLLVYNTPNQHADIGNPEFEPWRLALSMSNIDEWRDCVEPYISVFDKDSENSGETLAAFYRIKALGNVADFSSEKDLEGSNLCNIEFSLAFGGKILLHNTRLKLGIGKRYAVMGKNGAGKTTLLTNIGTGNIEGLPETLKTVYVQHDDSTEDLGVPLLDEMIQGRDLKDVGITREEAKKALAEINFTEDMMESPRSALSGGWKMKVLIIRAMLSKADVLLLDEPTNHLDQASVQWLVTYLQEKENITCLIVSHDTAFLDKVVTDVIHYENRKLVYYSGNISDFVKIKPEAKYYFELDGESMKFDFPIPERLDGINSTTRAIITLKNATYTYPGTVKPIIKNANVKLCLASRVAVTGANGAGKSTLIRMLVQETKPDEDDSGVEKLWKHHNLRIAYVAQHSLHHVDQHLDESPVDYIKWRFAGGADKEDLMKQNMKLTDEEVEERAENKKYGDIIEIFGRRKNGRTMEYECSFVGQTPRDDNRYINMETLIERGYQKLITAADLRIAARAAGLEVRPLLIKEIQSHLDNFNLESEFGTHSKIRRLSGGQKVKLVLAAAMWNRPHLIILDEPTNYLDREALGALTQAIKNFAGGVAIISHNAEFTDALCTEKWLVSDGVCHITGEAIESALQGVTEKKQKKTDQENLEKGLVKEHSLGGCTNKTVDISDLKNPRSLEPFSKKEIRKLEKCALSAGVPLREYVQKITRFSPEYKWLSGP